jgi:DNA polymerase-3 subunit epsilon
MKTIYIDTETGGPDPRNCCLLQISGAIEIDWVIKEKFNIFVRPFPDDPEITKEATDKHGITKEIILENPTKFIDPKKAFQYFKGLLSKYVDPYNKKDKYQFIGYNCQTYDDPVLRTFFSKNGDVYYGSWFWYPTIDVMQLYAADWAQNRDRLENFQLLTVAKAAGMNIDPSKLHDGLYDIQITRELYIRRYRRILLMTQVYQKVKDLEKGNGDTKGPIK